jgi:hypothetical protein
MPVLKICIKIFTLSLFILTFTSCKEEIKKEKETVVKEETTSNITKAPVLNQKLSNEQQIACAIFAVPEQSREGAKVYGYDKDGNFITLREGTNSMICIADNPNKDGFEVVSYHKDIEPYMARGRDLKAQGITGEKRKEIREKEAKDGTLLMPKKTATLHILHGKEGWFDTESNEIKNARFRYVVYIPFATQETTGLDLAPNASGHPWLMFPGKAGAHIMITPPAKD